MEVRVILSKDAETNTYFDSLMRESAQDSICVLIATMKLSGQRATFLDGMPMELYTLLPASYVVFFAYQYQKETQHEPIYY